ncbi:MAG: hypothetical protein M3O02_03310 [Acidobacteriota bacterium]|nr:hypothetical protein [Acidobacteriota bacterium]
MGKRLWMRQVAAAVFGLCLAAPGVRAQDVSSGAAGFEAGAEVASAVLPEAPSALAGQSSSIVVEGAEKTPPEHQDPQTKRILGIFPNFRSVSSSAHLPPQTVKDKFVTATQDSFDYSAFVLPALLAAQGQASNSTPEFHQGAAGYGRYFWHAYTDQTIENYMVEFIVPAVAHEDTRFYTLGHGGFVKRAGYALGRVAVTRNDQAKRTFNFGEVLGAGAAAGISNLYYPQAERTVSNTMTRWGLNVGIDAGTFVLREFWPDVNHYLFHGKSTQRLP